MCSLWRSSIVQPRVSRKSVDIVLKYTADALGGALFARFGLPFPPIVAGLPSELPQLLISSQQTDLLFRLADGSILHLEFQTTRRSGDILRFAAYHLTVYGRYKRPVHTVVLYGAGIRSAAATLDTGALTFHVHNIFLRREDGEATLRRLHEKVARDEPFTETDRIDSGDTLWRPTRARTTAHRRGGRGPTEPLRRACGYYRQTRRSLGSPDKDWRRYGMLHNGTRPSRRAA